MPSNVDDTDAIAARMREIAAPETPSMSFEEWQARVLAEILKTIPEEHCEHHIKLLGDQWAHDLFLKGENPEKFGDGYAEGIDDWLNYGQYED